MAESNSGSWWELLRTVGEAASKGPSVAQASEGLNMALGNQPGSPEYVKQQRQDLVRGPVDTPESRHWNTLAQPLLEAQFSYDNPIPAQQAESSTFETLAPWIASLGGPRGQAGVAVYDTIQQRRKQDKKATLEEARQRTIADETQAIVGLLSVAMQSEPDKAASMVKGISSFKGLQPETVKNVFKEQLEANKAIKEAKSKAEADQAAMEALNKLDPNKKNIVDALMKAVPTLGAANAYNLVIKSGVYGEPSQLMNTSQGAYQSAPTGAHTAGYTGPAGGTMLTSKADELKPPQMLETAFFIATKGRTKVMDNTVTPAEAKMALDLVKSPELTPGLLGQRMDLARAGAETRATVQASMTAQTALTELYNAETVLNTLKDMSSQLFTAKTEPEAFVQGSKYTTQSYVPGAGQPYKRYIDSIEAYKVLLGKTQFGHVGVQTEKDAQSTAKALADPFSTVETVAFKMGMVTELLGLKKYQLTEIAEGRRVDMAEVQRRSADVTRRLTVGIQRMKEMPAGFAFVPGSVDIIYQKSNPRNTQRWKDK